MMANRFYIVLFFLLISAFSTPLFAETQPQASTAPSASTANPPPPQISLEQFQQWLQSNGYANAPSAQETVVNPPTSATQPPTQAEPVRVQAKGQQPPLTYQEGQQIMLENIPSTRPISQEARAAFSAMLQSNMPLTPQQVVQLHQQIDLAQRAAFVPPNIPPKPVSTTLMVNLAPGTTPPAVRLAQGYVSSLVFIDSASQPWPIASFDIGNPKSVNVQWDGKSNIILLQAISSYSYGDIVVRLVGLPTPITLELISGQRVVDYRVDLHISGIGPNTKEVPMGTALPNSVNQLLLSVLDGIAPAGSKLLTVNGADAQAWLLGEKMYLRTRLTLLSPGWIGTLSSPDGMHAYELPKTSSVLVSRYGEPAELKIEGF